jgi:acetyl-CoA carboxylase biotin carboxyl carrier protein
VVGQKDLMMAENQKDSDLKKIQELIEVMKANDLLELEVKHGEDKILLKRTPPAQAVSPGIAALPMIGTHVPGAAAMPGQPAGQPAADKGNLVEIKSPLVGTFYAKPSPDSEPYVEFNSHVGLQTVVCIIEAMKVMNEIKAETSGTVVEILVNNGQAVEYGQVLFRVKPD